MSNENQETIADIVREMREDITDGTVGMWSDFGGEIARCFADRIEAAARQEVTDCNHLGNAAAMREALSDACYAMFNFLKTQNGGYEEMAKALDKAKAALAEAARESEVSE